MAISSVKCECACGRLEFFDSRDHVPVRRLATAAGWHDIGTGRVDKWQCDTCYRRERGISNGEQLEVGRIGKLGADIHGQAVLPAESKG